MASKRSSDVQAQHIRRLNKRHSRADRNESLLPSGWCAWQELNLLPFGPEPNALSGELQARAGSPV
jgi:hypothetical protein